MKCLKCNNTEFSTKKIRFTPELKGETLEVLLPAYVCKECGETLMDSKQMNALRKAAADEYKSNYGLLTSQEIVALRENLGMSQAEFARYLKVGEASIKRWETYYIQDEGQDEHIRLKSDEASAESNALEMHWKNSHEDIYGGNRKFNYELFKNVVLSLVKHCKSPLFINKALFYVDFLHFRNHGKSLTGSRYITLEYGPCPDQFQSIFRHLENQEILKRIGKYNFAAKVKADNSVFDDQELETLNIIIELAKKDGGRKLYDLSHKEIAFEKTPFACAISYKHAKDLKLK